MCGEEASSGMRRRRVGGRGLCSPQMQRPRDSLDIVLADQAWISRAVAKLKTGGLTRTVASSKLKLTEHPRHDTAVRSPPGKPLRVYGTQAYQSPPPQ